MISSSQRPLPDDTQHSLLLSALQLFMIFGLLIYFFPLLPLLRPLFPIGHPHLPQIIPHIVFPSYSSPSLRSWCIRFPFVYGLSHSFITHSFYMTQPAQSYTLHSQQTNIHSPGGIRTHDRSRRETGRPTPWTARPLGPALWHWYNILFQHGVDAYLVTQ